MKFNRTASRVLALAAVVLVAAVTTISHNQEVAEPSLGPGWQCSRAMLLATTCSHSSAGQEHRSRPLLAAEQ